MCILFFCFIVTVKHGSYHYTFVGEFGVVYKGYIKTSMSDSVSNIVAVKTLKGIVAGYL